MRFFGARGASDGARLEHSEQWHGQERARWTRARRGAGKERGAARVVSELEAGRFPWVQPWDAAVACPGLPRNAVTGRTYSGVNVLILWGEVIAKGFANQDWLTFRQALAAGGCVRKGERGATVCYADRFTPEAEKERAKANGDEAKAVPFLKRFVVFNVAQCDGLPDQYHADAPPPPEREQVPVAESLIAATGADFRIGGARAFYCPSEDFVQVPPQPASRKQIDYYRTALHELVHWTGHKSRLARTFGGRFGDSAYAREELAAELTSAFLCAALGIVPTWTILTMVSWLVSCVIRFGRRF